MPSVKPDQPLPTAGYSVIEPDPEGLLQIVGSLGYSLEDALADLVDNSVDAGATRVRVRIVRRGDRLQSVVIADNGSGMTEGRLDAAMGFGVHANGSTRGVRLGKYGLGLKSASFSQCSKLTVVSRPARRETAAGRVWTAAGVAAGWNCEHLAPGVAGPYLDFDWLDGERVNTIVRWDDLYAFRIPAARTDTTLAELFDDAALHLGLHLHRFIEAGLEITLDTYDAAELASSFPRFVEPRDPFGYPRSGNPAYPKQFNITVHPGGSLVVEAHIWPHGMRPMNLMLGRGQLAVRQGFYFYRNRRIIQAGGWNGVRADAEPHFSLARARVFLTEAHDAAFGLNVRKAGVNVPANFETELLLAKSDGTSFKQYLSAAERVYRTKGNGPERRSNFVPDGGLPRGLAKLVRKQTRAPKVTPVSFEWRRLDEDLFFELDRDTYTILLNSRYRSAVLHGGRGSAADAPLLKTLLFLRLKDDLGMERIWEKRGKELQDLQQLLVAAARSERSR